MKNTALKTLGIFVFLSFFNVCSAGETISLANDEFPPWMSDKLKYKGIFSRIVTEAFASQGIAVTYHFMPPARSKAMARDGELDGSLGWSKKPEREKFFYFSDPIFVSKKVFFHLKNKAFDWEEIADLKNYMIGATIEYNYGQEFELAEKTGIIHVERVPNDMLNFEKLLRNRIDIFPHNLSIGLYMLHDKFGKEASDKITFHPKPIIEKEYHLVLSKKIERNVQMMILFNAGLKHLKENGKFEQFIEESKKEDAFLKN